MSRPKVSNNGTKSMEITLKISEDMLGQLTGTKTGKPTAAKPKTLTAGKPKEVPAEKVKKTSAEKSKKVPAGKPKKAPAEKPKTAPAEKPKKVPAEKPKKVPAEKPKKVPTEKHSSSTRQAGAPHITDVHSNDILGDFTTDPSTSGLIFKHPKATRAADREQLRREYEYFSYAFKLHDRVRQDDGKPLRPEFEKLADKAEDGRINWSTLPPMKKHEKKFKDYADAADQVMKMLQKCASDGEKDEQSEARRLMKEFSSKMSKLAVRRKGPRLDEKLINMCETQVCEDSNAGRVKVEDGANKRCKLEANDYYDSDSDTDNMYYYW